MRQQSDDVYDALAVLGALHEVFIRHDDPNDPIGLFWNLGLPEEEERRQATQRGLITRNAGQTWDLAKKAAWGSARSHKKMTVKSDDHKITAVAVWREQEHFAIAAAARSKKRAEEMLNFLTDLFDNKYGQWNINRIRFLFLAIVLHNSLPEN
jgi:hypothetical protein